MIYSAYFTPGNVDNSLPNGRFRVDSAGTGGWHIGNKADSRMREAANKRGIEIKSIARQINLQDFQIFDLILTMDNSNLKDVKSLLEEVGENGISEIIPLLSYSKNSQLLEVPDPYYGGENCFDEVLDLIEDAVEELILSIE